MNRLITKAGGREIVFIMIFKKQFLFLLQQRNTSHCEHLEKDKIQYPSLWRPTERLGTIPLLTKYRHVETDERELNLIPHT